MASIERDPIPGRTKRGAGEGAKLDLSIYYYRPTDGQGPDYGTFYGRDADGRWELHFANPDELDSRLARIVSALEHTATQAREESQDGDRQEGRTVWLKAIGAQGLPVKNIWWNERDRDQGVDFPYRPRSIKRGDLLVVYAAGTGKVAGVLEVTSNWFEGGETARWRYRMNTKIRAAKPVSEGIALDSLSDEREIGKSIRQKSYVRLSDAEARTALDAFGIDG